MPDFGKLGGDIDNVYIEKTRLGKIIENNIHNLHKLNPLLEVIQYVIMPDHIYFLLFVTDTIEKPVGNYIGMMKVRIGQEFRAAGGPEGPVFDKNFDDRILHRRRQLTNIVNYIRENPRRLAVRRARPEFFRRVNGLEIGGRRYAAYGNTKAILLFAGGFYLFQQAVVFFVVPDERNIIQIDKWFAV